MNKKEVKKEEKKVSEFKLPKYLRLAKGTMFFDEQGEDASGVRLYALTEVFISRDLEMVEGRKGNGEMGLVAKATKIPEDKYKNKNLTDFGKIDNKSLPWYIDTTKIESNKLSRIITAFKYGILVEADPNNPPEITKKPEVTRQFEVDDKGARIFTGKNKDMFVKLQNLNFSKLKEFVIGSPKTNAARDNLMDLYAYELHGHNPLNRPRKEVVDLIKSKLKEYGPGISSIRVNEDD